MFQFTCNQGQKKSAVEEEAASRKMGLGICLLPASKEDAASAALVNFSSKFERNRKDKRAAIKSSIFPGTSSSAKGDRRLELESKWRRIEAASASALLAGRVKPSAWAQHSSSDRQMSRSVISRKK